MDVGTANGTGELQEIVCGARNFAVGDKVVVVLPGAVLPGNFAIAARKTYGKTSHGMICSGDELGMGDDGSGGIIVLPPEVEVATDAIELLQLVDEVLDIAVTPDRGYALSMRGVAREAAIAYGLPLLDPALLDVPAPNAFGYPVRVSDPMGCDRFTATVTGLDPETLSPIWLRRRLQKAGHAPDLARRRHHQLRDAGARPAPHAYDRTRVQGAIGVRRAEQGEKLTTLYGVTRTLDAEDLVITDDRGPIGLVGRHGWGEHGDRRHRGHHHRGRHRGRALRRALHRAHGPPSQAGLRGVQALRARRRPAGRLRRRPAHGRPPRPPRRRHRRRRGHRGHRALRAAQHHHPGRTTRTRWPVSTTAARPSSAASSRSAATSTGRTS